MNWETYKVDVPEGTCGGMEIARFVAMEDDPTNLRLLLHGRTPIEPGIYTRLSEGGTVWMSDTQEEIITHLPAITQMLCCGKGSRVLIHGLGLGMIVQAALRAENVARVDVVELDERVIALVGDHYETMAKRNGKELCILHGSAFDDIWSAEARWDVVWHDIWPATTPSNLPEMARLKRMFARRCRWQGCWNERKCRDIKSGAYAREHREIMERFYEQIGLTKELMAQLVEHAKRDTA